MRKPKSNILLVVIIFLAFVLRVYAIDRIPLGLTWDEAAIGYNAYSILKTGRDEYGEFMPLLFTSFRDWKLPGLIYLTTISEAIFGLNEFAIRFPSVVAGTLTVLAIYYLLRQLDFSKNISLFGTFCLAILPWHIHFSRVAYEPNLGFFFLVTGLFFFLKAINTTNKPSLVLSVLSFTASLYSYHAERIFTPLLIVFLFFWDYRKLRLFSNKLLVGSSLLALLLSLPIILTTFSAEGTTRAQSQLFLKDVEIGTFDPFLTRLDKYTAYWLRNYTTYYSFDFIFFLGDLSGRGSVREMGLLYLWMLPLVLIGIYQVARKSSHNNGLLLFLLVAAGVSAAFFQPSPQAHRGMILILPLILLITYGGSFLSRFNYARLSRNILLILTVLIIIRGLIVYLHLYYVHYSFRSSIDWQDGYKQMVKEIKPYLDEVSHVYITKEYHRPYLYLLIYLPYDPKEYILEGGSEAGFGKFTFVKSPFMGEHPSNSLYVAAPWEGVDGEFIKDIYFTNGEVAFQLWKI